MKARLFATSLLLALASSQAQAGWTPFLDVQRIEIAAAGVFLVGPVTGVTGTNCNSTQTHMYVLFPSTNEKLADRAMSGTMFALSLQKQVKVFVESCTPGYAVANSIWIQ